jgi:hypothetical protein
MSPNDETLRRMSPEDLTDVGESWAELRAHRVDLIDRLVDSYGAVVPAEAAEQRARWLVDAVAELIDLLGTPSRLADRARQLAQTSPAPGSAPTFLLDGNAWMSAAADACPTWTRCSEHAWRQAWLLLSDVLANESLSPFTSSEQR